MELIPGLPDDLARECLSRVSCEEVSSVGSICRGWKAEIESPAFLSQRRSAGQSQVLVVLAQARPNPSERPGSPKQMLPPVCLLSVYEPLTGRWTDLQPPPGCTNGLPRFCRLAAVGMELVVVGGLDPVTWDASAAVYIYSFLSGKWRRGNDMPACGRIFFGCASDGESTLFVAGGHDTDKNALRSALAYDVRGDRWVPVPDMAIERDECRVAFRGGEFVVVSGYTTDAQGKFERSVEAFDVATWSWRLLEENILDNHTSPRTCVEGGPGDDSLYALRKSAGDVAALRGSAWRSVANLPVEVTSRNNVLRWCDKLMVFGWGSEGRPEDAVFVLDLCSSSWTKMEVPEGYSGAVMEGCVLEI
ncbi:hypothetical protein SAY86_025318 [Trapa natans]|uniref:F-box domain-containing protein n=1 Tax=Trapa natans TaxID=22666 RepID=A0AAN7RKM1_TRANT|nr:hypothetical protein SAY86_025318 [Trapa natans]